MIVFNPYLQQIILDEVALIHIQEWQEKIKVIHEE